MCPAALARKPRRASHWRAALRSAVIGQVRALLGAGADVSMATTYNGKSPVFKAAIRGHTEVVRLLLDAGADVNQGKTSDNASPLYGAVYAGHAATARLLIARGADIEAALVESQLEPADRDPKYIGSTPLHAAAFFGQPDCAQVLLEAGADRSATNKLGATPLDAAGSGPCRLVLL